MREVHNYPVSRQTVSNYAKAVSHYIEHWLDSYHYNSLSENLCADETYVKIKG